MTDEVKIWDGIEQENGFDFDEEGVSEEIEEVSDGDENTLPVEFGIDFNTGQLTGGRVTGLEAIKVWVWNALRTPRYVYEQNSWNYGCELEDLIGRAQMPREYIASEAKRMIEETVVQNEYIEGIRDFDCLMVDGILVCMFRIITTFGEVDSDVTVR